MVTATTVEAAALVRKDKMRLARRQNMPRKLPLRPLKAKGARERNKRSQTLAGLKLRWAISYRGRTYEDEKHARSKPWAHILLDI